jgi:hypothetical protein
VNGLSVILSEAKDLLRSRRREQILRAFGPQNDRDGEALRMTGMEETRGDPPDIPELISVLQFDIYAIGSTAV